MPQYTVPDQKKFVAFPGTDLSNVLVNMYKEEERSIEQNNLEYQCSTESRLWQNETKETQFPYITLIELFIKICVFFGIEDLASK